MSFFVPLKQTTLHIPNTGPAHDRRRGHLFVILTSPSSDKKVLTVSISSAHDRCDKTCMLNAGVHKFIRHDSFVLYALVQMYDADVLCNNHKEGICEYMGLIDHEIFERICDGLLDSEHTPPWARNYFIANADN